MVHSLIDRIGDWNPQLLRELKGRFKGFNIAIAIILSFLTQLLVFLFQLREFPTDRYSLMGQYCQLRSFYEQRNTELYQQSSALYRQLDSYKNTQPIDDNKILAIQNQIKQADQQLSDFNVYLSRNFCSWEKINIQDWWQDHWEYIFLSLSVIFIFTLLVAGTYLLINNLAQEEQRGTLNFIRLSPTSDTSFLVGKILGVPILIYLSVFLALPLHLWAGHLANIALSHIFYFYLVVIFCCVFFYSAGVLFGLCGRWLSSFQPWLGSGAVLLFLLVTLQIALDNPRVNSSVAWFSLLSPFHLMTHLFANFSYPYKTAQEALQKLQFAYLPLGKSLFALVGVHLLNYVVWTSWLWQGLKRCFRNPSTTVFSKGQSYLLVACVQVLLWGFTLQNTSSSCSFSVREQTISCHIEQNFGLSLVINLFLLFALMAIISPHRQVVQDWSRYRHQQTSHTHGWRRKTVLSDLIWGEKSPAVVAIALNLLIITAPWMIWAIVSQYGLSSQISKWKALLGIALLITLMMIYATVTQLMLMMKTPKRSLWAIGTMSTAIFLPPTLLALFGVQPKEQPILWLFSTFSWASLEYVAASTVLLTFLGELSVLILLNWQLTKQVKRLGESTTKMLLSESS